METQSAITESNSETETEISDLDIILAEDEALDAARSSLLAFTVHTHPDYRTGWHHRLIAKKVEAVISGEIKNLIVCCPPRQGKSTLISRHLPAWIFGRDPNASIIACSYSADLANAMNKDVQRIMLGDEYKRIFPNTKLNEKGVVSGSENWKRSAGEFEIVGHRGYYKCAGVGGGITGRGAGTCIAEGSFIETTKGPILIEHLFRSFHNYLVLGYDEKTEKIEPHKIQAARKIENQETFRIVTASGNELRLTGDHRVFVYGQGYREAKSLRNGDRLVSFKKRGMPEVRIESREICQPMLSVLHDSEMCGYPSSMLALQNQIQKKDIRITESKEEGTQGPLLFGDMSCYTPQVEIDTVSLVEKLCGESINVYDIQVEGTSNFFAEKILVHNCILIDDPFKSRQEAESATVRSRVWNWFQDDLKTRLDGNGGIILVNTRWHEDDLTGMLMKKMKEDPDSDQWEILNLPVRLDEYCHPEDPRELGEVIWPWWYAGKRDDLTDEEMESLSKDKVRLWEHNNPYGFASLGQQDPAPRTGNMFKVERIELVHTVPSKRVKTVRYFDKAGTEGGGCFTAGVKMSLLENGMICIEHCVKGQWSAFNREKVIKDTAQLDGKSVIIVIEQEPGSGGKESAENTVKNLVGWIVRLDKPSGDKVLRADPFSSQIEGGNVCMLIGDWNQEYKEEMRYFPASKYKDQVDASSGAFNYLTAGRQYSDLNKL